MTALQLRSKLARAEPIKSEHFVIDRIRQCKKTSKDILYLDIEN